MRRISCIESCEACDLPFSENVRFEADLALVSVCLQRVEDRLPIELFRIVEHRLALDLHIQDTVFGNT